MTAPPDDSLRRRTGSATPPGGPNSCGWRPPRPRTRPAAVRAEAEAAAARPLRPAALAPVVRTADGADVAAPVLIECGGRGATFRPAGGGPSRRR